MNFDYSEEQTMLRDSVKRYVADTYGFEVRKAIVAAGGFSATVWGDFAELGVLGLTVPADAGGSEMGAQEAMVVLEELGRGIVLEPVAALSLMPVAILSHALAGNGFADLLGGIADGSKRVAVAYVEHGARYHLSHCSTTATANGAAWTLTGSKGVVTCADTCDAFIVPAMTPQGLSLFLVDAKAAGATNTIKATGYPTQDGGCAGELHLNKTAGTLIGAAGKGMALFATWD